MKIYQILYKGVYTNKLTLIETKSIEEFKGIIEDFNKGKYKNIILLNTNIYMVS